MRIDISIVIAAMACACGETTEPCRTPMPANLAIFSSQETKIIASVEVKEAECKVVVTSYPTKDVSVVSWGTGCSGVVRLISGKTVPFNLPTRHISRTGLLGSTCDWFEFVPPFVEVYLDPIEMNDGAPAGVFDAGSGDIDGAPTDTIDAI